MPVQAHMQAHPCCPSHTSLSSRTCTYAMDVCGNILLSSMQAIHKAQQT